VTATAPAGPMIQGALPPGWRGGWRRYVFPSIWLAYLAQTVSGVHQYSHGWAAVLGYALVVAFAGCYLAGLTYVWAGRPARYWAMYVAMSLLCAAEAPLAHQDAFVMFAYLAVVTVGLLRRYALPVIVALAGTAAFVPALVPVWHVGIQSDWLVTIPLIAVAMWGFFAITQSNRELAAARAEVARLAAENERTRIARDLHDLLGHSLTTITVKAGLARRLSERGEVARATAEIGEVERLSRRTLADVRAAVSGHRDITLAGELASAREVLRAAGILADLPGSIDIVDPSLSELFGWVVREGVTNMVRHSRATHCTITFGPDWIEVVDDGHGGRAAPGTGSGLVGLRERVASFGGTVDARPLAPGWRLRVDVPVPTEPSRLDAAPPRHQQLPSDPSTAR
jgi:two-component system sensor histidine kinase DesK